MIYISVITVVRDDPEGLSKTLTSVFSQVGIKLESIVIDGGSGANTLDVLRQFKQVSSWVSEPDDGIYHAMDKGIAKAKGRWVIFLNAGDSFLRRDSVKVMALDQAEEFAIVYGAKKYNGLAVDPLPVGAATRAGVIFACHQAMAFNKILLGPELHYHRDFKVYGDYELIARLYESGFRFLQRQEEIIDFEGGGVSSRTSLDKRLEKYKTLYKYYGALGVMRGLINRMVKRF